MNIIDMHTHTFPDKIAGKAIEKLSIMSGTCYFTDGTESGLIDSSQNAGITYSVILPVATSPEQVVKINDGVIGSASSRLSKGIISFGAMHPDFASPEEELARLKAAGVKGIKLHPAYTATDFDDPKHVRILKACAANDLLVTTHAGIDIGIPEKDYCDTHMILRVLEQIPDLKLILAHMGGWTRWDNVAHNLAGTSVYYDTSFSFGPLKVRPDRNPAEIPSLMEASAFVDLCHVLGTDRILFGTDSPWTDQADSVAQILALPLSEAEKESILYDNAKQLLF